MSSASSSSWDGSSQSTSAGRVGDSQEGSPRGRLRQRSSAPPAVSEAGPSGVLARRIIPNPSVGAAERRGRGPRDSVTELWVRSPTEGPRVNIKKRSFDQLNYDIEIGPEGTIPTTDSGSGSYSTRRKRVAQANSRARLRAASRQKSRPEFDHIQVSNEGTFVKGFRPGLRFSAPDALVQEYVQLEGLPKGVKGPENSCFMQSCDDAQMRHLKHFDREPRKAPIRDLRSYEKAVSFVEELLTLNDPLPFPHAEDLEHVRYKKSKYPGVEYRAMGFKTREEAHDRAVVDAKLAWSDLMMGEDVRPHHVRMGGRGKTVFKSELAARKDGTPQGRLILMTSHRDLLLTGVVEQRLTKAYCADEFPVSLGLGWYAGNPAKFGARYNTRKKHFCFDAEKYDANIDPYLVLMALRILRSQFQDGWDSKYDLYWEFVAETLLYAPIQRDDGWVMRKQVGTTSGHSFNTLVQSIITLVLGYTTALSLHDGDDEDKVLGDLMIESLGDDNLLSSEGLLLGFSCDEIADRMYEIFEISWRGNKSFATTRFADPVVADEAFTEDGCFQGVQYLGKYFRGIELDVEDGVITTVIPYRPAQETFTHLYYPERGGKGVRDSYLRALGNLLDAYGNPWMAAWLNSYLDWLETKMEILPTEWEPNQVVDAAKAYGHTEVEVPRPKRWKYEEWIELVLWEKAGQPQRFYKVDVEYI